MPFQGCLGIVQQARRGNAHAERGDQDAAAQLQQIGIDDGADVFVRVFGDELVVALEAAKHVGPQVGAIDVEVGKDSRLMRAPGAAFVVGNGFAELAAGAHLADQAASMRAL